ncbi:MAG: ribonuclease III [Firmicutes bacterium HGW-Firmicutes-1]|nr:MAG: ribonuclease III [Firmicutes bacterium HGW-Firmicutes-1]
MDNFLDYFEEKFNIQEIKLNQYSPLVLAYIGDAVYEMMIRTVIVNEGNMQVNKMHKMAKDLVKASAQAEIYYIVESMLTEEELNIFKRGRNAKSATKAKNASLIDYRTATGFETLIGYLYLKKDFKRMTDLVSEGVKGCQSNQNDL